VLGDDAWTSERKQAESVENRVRGGSDAGRAAFEQVGRGRHITQRAAFVALGFMEYPMAEWLRRAGDAVTVLNRTAATARAWAEEYEGSVPRRRRGREPGLHVWEG
jgi:glutamyl-tRNA reductase